MIQTSTLLLTFLLGLFFADPDGAEPQPHTSAASVVAAPKAYVASIADSLKQESGKKKKKKAKTKEKAKVSKVTMSRNVDRASLTRRSETGRFVEVKIMKSGMQTSQVEDLQLTSNSGTTVTSGNFIGFENMEFPFEGYIRFKAPNKMGTTVYDREVRVTVIEPGTWVLKVDI